MKDIKWTVAAILSVLGIVGGVIYGYATLEHEVADNTEEIAEMLPEHKAGIVHRAKFEEKVENIEKDVGAILEIVQEISKK